MSIGDLVAAEAGGDPNHGHAPVHGTKKAVHLAPLIAPSHHLHEMAFKGYPHLGEQAIEGVLHLFVLRQDIGDHMTSQKLKRDG